MSRSQAIISGIQQIGIGVGDIHTAWKWYRKVLGMDVPIFEEAAEARLMLPYTGGNPQKRHAVLAYNIQGGGGMEIWQYVSRIPQPAPFELQLGDLGIFSVRIKCKHVFDTYTAMEKKGVSILNKPANNPSLKPSFFIKDDFGNVFQMEAATDWFFPKKLLCGGVSGCLIGVSDIDRALTLYRDILGYDKILYDMTGTFEDFAGLPGGNNIFRRVLLASGTNHRGGFSRFFGSSKIELVQVLDRIPNKIFQNRYWGDLGFIHLCFDVHGMEHLKEKCKERGFAFTVDSSNSFSMGEAAGHFSYIEDPDGTLIEFVETHKIPIIKKIGWYMNLKNRNPEKALPDWILKSLQFNRVRD